MELLDHLELQLARSAGPKRIPAFMRLARAALTAYRKEAIPLAELLARLTRAEVFADDLQTRTPEEVRSDRYYSGCLLDMAGALQSAGSEWRPVERVVEEMVRFVLDYEAGRAALRQLRA